MVRSDSARSVMQTTYSVGQRLVRNKYAKSSIAILFTASIVITVYFTNDPYRRVTKAPDAVNSLPAVSSYENNTGRYVSMCLSTFSTKDRRRLGNHLFNFAAMVHVAKLTGRQVAMVRKHHSGWLDNVFNVNITRVDDIEREICPCHSLKAVRVMQYDSNLPKMASSKTVFPGESILVCGYTQSWKYTIGVEAELRHYLRLRESLSNAVDWYLEEIVPKRWLLDPSIVYERVVIHIRVGDFLREKIFNMGFSIPQLPYFHEALLYVVNNVTIPARTARPGPARTARRRRIQIIVISESLDWCRKSLNMSSIVAGLRSPAVDVDLIYADGKSAEFHFVLMMKSDFAIITSGSFGWWGAWLSNKTTIYYRNFPRPGSGLLKNQFIQQDYYPTEWIPIGGPWFEIRANSSV